MSIKSKSPLTILFETTSAFFVFFLTFVSIPFLSNFWQEEVFAKMSNDKSYIVIGETVLRAEIVDEPLERSRGLSGRDEIKATEGMLFVWEKPDKYGIWMKEMNFPIDIIWIDEKSEVIYMKKNALPESYPEIFYPDKPAKYVLEVYSGFIEDHGIKNGDLLNFY